MDGESLKLVGALAAAPYLGWLLRKGLASGTLQSPGAGASVRRDRHPALFRATAALFCVAIALALLVAALALAGIAGLR